MLDAIVYGNITQPMFFAIIFLIILIIGYALQYISFRKRKNIMKIYNYIFTGFACLIFSIAIFMTCIVLFNELPEDKYTDVAVENYELYNYKDYSRDIVNDIYVLKDNLTTKGNFFILIKTGQGIKSIEVTPKESEEVIINITNDTKPSYVIYERKYKNIYMKKIYVQHVINIPRGTIGIEK